MNSTTLQSHQRLRSILLWSVVILSMLSASLALVVAATPVGMIAAGAPAGLALVFSILHGSMSVGWRGICAFAGIGYLGALLLEANSVAFGFPFGYYEHFGTGPRLLDIPIIVPLIYIAYGWPAWFIANLLVRGNYHGSSRSDRVAIPIVAAFILTGWDFAHDAIYSSIQGLYAYRNPGGLFGVPLSNYLGWLFTGWVVFQLFSLVEHRFLKQEHPLSQTLLLTPIIIWTVPVFPLLGQMLTADPLQTIEVGDRIFRVADIYAGSLAAAVLTLVFVAILALTRLYGSGNPPPSLIARVLKRCSARSR